MYGKQPKHRMPEEVVKPTKKAGAKKKKVTKVTKKAKTKTVPMKSPIDAEKKTKKSKTVKASKKAKK